MKHPIDTVWMPWVKHRITAESSAGTSHINTSLNLQELHVEVRAKAFLYNNPASMSTASALHQLRVSSFSHLPDQVIHSATCPNHDSARTPPPSPLPGSTRGASLSSPLP